MARAVVILGFHFLMQGREMLRSVLFFFQAEDGIRYLTVTGVQTCALPIFAALCHHLGLTRVAVIGMSQGARSALAFAGGAPERVDAVILDGPPSFELAPADEEVPFEHFRTVARTRGMPAFRREWLRHPLTQLRTADPQMRAHLIAMIERFAGNELTSSAPEPDMLLVPALPRLSNAPTLVLSGELDVPRRVQSADCLSVQLPCAERAVITAAGHLPNPDRPDEYSETCRAFLNRHTRARSTP